MSTRKIQLPELHEHQAAVVSEAVRFNVVDCGRRWGKTLLGQDRLIMPALDGFPVGWFSPTYKMLSDVWRDVRHTVTPIAERINAQEHRIDLITGGVIDMWSLDQPDSARGRKYKRVVIDEAAMVKDLENAWNAVIRPTLTDYIGDGWFLSTPKGYNFFKMSYDWGQDPSREEWRSWQMPTATNPYIQAKEIEAAKRDLPERIFAQEYLAAFLEDAGGVFRHVTQSATAQEQTEADPLHSYVIGADWGKHEDFTAFAVIDLNTRELCHMDRFNQIDYALQRKRLMALSARFRNAVVIAEANAMGEPIVEQLQRDGLNVVPFVTTHVTKAVLIDGLALAFEQSAIRILNDQVLISELQAYEMTRTPTGLAKYGAPVGMHDDTVMALALAWSGATEAEPYGEAVNAPVYSIGSGDY